MAGTEVFFHRYLFGALPDFCSMQGCPTRGLPGCFMLAVATFLNCKTKAIPLQAWTGPEGSRRLRLPDVKTTGT